MIELVDPRSGQEMEQRYARLARKSRNPPRPLDQWWSS